mgnify:CR=1 FL=1
MLTSERRKIILESIRNEGLKKMSRQFVHLSADKETAKKVGYRKKGNLLIIKIKSKEAFENDIKFYKEENGVWLCDEWLLLIAKNFNLRFLNFIKCSINRYFIKL